ncbi:MAG: tRNA glutamyl-Q(34) synthetase GluQRS [Burkholderiaceae bacterium]
MTDAPITYTRTYTGRFAPSPTGPLHAGSLVAALGSWLDARAHGGRWLVRIEDVDMPRCVPGAAAEILRQLALLGLHPDEPPLYQSTRGPLYQTALAQLQAAQRTYPCACSRKSIQAALAALGIPPLPHAEQVYPGTCRPQAGGLQGRRGRAWRLDTQGPAIRWQDRRLGPQCQHVASQVGDFVLRRADGHWAYQLAVVVDDAAQGITDVVRGEDLADNTARQILLLQALGLQVPRYLHLPLVLAADGKKLSKQNGAQALDTTLPAMTLRAAAACLGLTLTQTGLTDMLAEAIRQWKKAVLHEKLPGQPGAGVVKFKS